MEKTTRGRPRTSFLHSMRKGDHLPVKIAELESVKQTAYRINSSGEKLFRFFTDGKCKCVVREK